MTGILCPDCGAYISTRFPYHDCKSKDKNMKAYYAYIDGEEWGILVHGETRGKAKLRFYRCEPSGNVGREDWISIRLRRQPEWDNKVFEGKDFDEFFDPESYDDQGDGIYPHQFNECNCELCKGAKNG